MNNCKVLDVQEVIDGLAKSRLPNNCIPATLKDFQKIEQLESLKDQGEEVLNNY